MLIWVQQEDSNIKKCDNDLRKKWIEDESLTISRIREEGTDNK
jgi:hypothetical protein